MEAFLKRLRGQAPKETLTNSYPDDDVYPVHAFDDTKTLRGILIAWTLCFNDVLDADKLQSSLTELLEIGDWRKLGGRLQFNASNHLSSSSSHDTNVLTSQKSKPVLWKSTSRGLSQKNAPHLPSAMLPMTYPLKSTKSPSHSPNPTDPYQHGLGPRRLVALPRDPKRL